MYYICLFASTVKSDNSLTLLPLHNVMVSNVTDIDDIAVLIEWQPPTDPNGSIVYYHVQYMQESDPLNGGNSGRRKRNIPLNTTVVTAFTNITEGSDGAPTNITLRGLG